MHRLPELDQRGFPEDLRQGRVGVNRQREILGRAAELHRQHRFGYHGVGIRSEDVNTQNPMCLRVRQDFDETSGVAVAPRSAYRREREFARLVLDAGSFELLFGLPD